jgi:hypothetical protein
MFLFTSLSLDLTGRAVALAVFLVAAAVFAYWRTTPSLDRRNRVVLSVLRALALTVLVALLLDPRAVRRGEREDPARVLLLLDRSASMSLPASGWSGGETRFAAARGLAGELAASLAERGARVETIPYDSRPDFAAGDSLAPDGQGTDLAGVLGEVARRYEGEHVAGVVVLGDGVETDAPLVRPELPGLPVWTVGFGDTVAPDDVRIAGVEYSPVVRAPSRAVIAAEIASTGSAPRRVHVRLSEGTRTVFETDTTFAAGDAQATIRLPVRIEESGRREMVLSVSSGGADVEPENNRRDVVIDAEKARSRALIVDLAPSWDLPFLTGLLASDAAYECVVFAGGQRPAAATQTLMRPEQFVAALAGADAVVLGAVSDAFLSEAVARALRAFVEDRGGGLLVLPGPGSLYETPGAWARLRALMPVEGTAPFPFVMQYTSVGPAARASSHPVTAPLVPLLSQAEWQERSPLLGYYGGLAAGPSAEILVGVRGRPAPALTWTTRGKGRVAAVTAGPLWRWKFLGESSGVYDELMGRLLDVLTRGEESGRFVLTAGRNVFDSGESPALFAEVFNDKLQPVTGVPVWVEVSRVDSAGAESPLARVGMHREGSGDTRLSVLLDPLPAGRYAVRGSAELPDRVIQSKPVEIRVSATSVEFRRTPQDRRALERVARRTGGAYLDPAGAAQLAPGLDLSPRRVPVVSESVLRAGVPLFLVVLALLSAEWLLRKRVGLI